MSNSMELSLEQKFNIRSFESQVKGMSHEQAQDFLVKLYEQMLIKDNMYQNFIRHQWGIDSPPGA
ncbi:NblA/ycf18 family protein [Pleurocapsa sp. FMAR1]|uniref:NblA/ycf18 family protein n=1 Tax=Pleurocapsa sp. FMAR1 TaxID=3040204 RepID=UPI0029C699A2|nr:NblA/ycf18 family protein [Pleurocapsa sp. FMAR1]